jgi:hypothetical protein
VLEDYGRHVLLHDHKYTILIVGFSILLRVHSQSPIKPPYAMYLCLCSLFITLISQHVSAPHGGHHQVSLQSYIVGSYCSFILFHRHTIIYRVSDQTDPLGAVTTYYIWL